MHELTAVAHRRSLRMTYIFIVVTVRVDAIGVFTDENGNDTMQILEFKSSETAPLTRNQAKVFSTIQTEGGVVVGAGKGFFHGGKLIPAGTPVKIIRKTQGGNLYVDSRSG